MELHFWAVRSYVSPRTLTFALKWCWNRRIYWSLKSLEVWLKKKKETTDALILSYFTYVLLDPLLCSEGQKGTKPWRFLFHFFVKNPQWRSPTRGRWHHCATCAAPSPAPFLAGTWTPQPLDAPASEERFLGAAGASLSLHILDLEESHGYFPTNSWWWC